MIHFFVFFSYYQLDEAELASVLFTEKLRLEEEEEELRKAKRNYERNAEVVTPEMIQECQVSGGEIGGKRGEKGETGGNERLIGCIQREKTGA